MLGGARAGLDGDRVGRRTALIGSMLVFGSTTIAAAAAGDVWTLGALRFATGIGLGGAIPNAAALAAEYAPKAQRPIAVTVAIVCIPFGGMLAPLVAIPAVPAFGWRALFAPEFRVDTVALWMSFLRACLPCISPSAGSRRSWRTRGSVRRLPAWGLPHSTWAASRVRSSVVS